MHALTTPTLTAEIDNTIVRLTVSGTPSQDELKTAMEWFDALQAQYEDIPLYLEIPKMHFDGLGDLRQTFLGLSNIMRGFETVERVAVVTDSPFLRSTAQIEGAVLPNTDVDAFPIVELAKAEAWLEAA